MKAVLRNSPGWAEVVYFNSFTDEDLFDKRDYLLAWVFAVIQKRYGFAMDIAMKGKRKFNDVVFSEMENFSQRRILLRMFNIPFFYANLIFERIFR